MRSGLLHGLAALILAFGLPQPAAAQYPDRAVKFVVGFPGGGSPDTFLRNFTQRLTSLAGQPVVVENKPGANAMVAAQSVATAKADGYTVLFAPDSTPVGNIFLFKQLTYDPEKDFAPVAPMVWNTFILVVNPQRTPVNSVAELTALLKSKGGRALYGITNSGAQLMGELYKAMAGVEVEGVNFRGTVDGINALVAGEIDFVFADIGAALTPIRDGRIKPLAVSSKRRPVLVPGVPTMAEAGFADFDIDGFFGAYVPAGTPADIRVKLNGWINQLAASEEIKSALAVVGAETFAPLTFDQLDALLRERRALWARLVGIAKIQPQ